MTIPVEGSAQTSKEGGLFENLVEVLFSPSRVFDRCRNAAWFKYAAVITLITLVLVIGLKGLFTPFIDAQIDLGMKLQAAKGVVIPPEQAAAGRVAGFWITLVIMGLIPMFSAIFAGLFLFLGAKIIRVPLKFTQAALIYSVTGLIVVLGYVAMAALGVVTDSTSARSMMDGTLSAARFFDPITTNPALLGLLARFDVFSLWNLALAAIGVSVIARVSKANGALAAIIGWGLTSLLSLAFATVSS